MIISRDKLTFSFLLALTFVFVQILIFIPRTEAMMTVDSFLPPDNGTGVVVDSNLSIDFSANWNGSNSVNGNITIFQNNGSIFETYYFPGNGTIPARISGQMTSDILTINPIKSLLPSSDYYVQIYNGIIIDNFGTQSYTGISDNTTWNFTTGADTSPPTVISFTPTDNSTDINTNINLVINFDEIVVVGAGNVYIRRMTDNAIIHTIDITSGLITGSGTSTLTINPSTDLSSYTAYYVEIDATAIDDNYGNSFAGISGNSTWNFTTKQIFDPSGWSDYISITIDSTQLNGDLTNYPIFVDLNHFNGTNFFSVVQSDGSDIRITKTDNATLLAREIVLIDTANGTGELHFLANGTLSSTADTTFHIFYGNGSNYEPASDSEFGSENVWSNNFAGVWHMSDAPTDSVASVFDSTANHNHAIPRIGNGTMALAAGRVGLGMYLDDNAYLMIPAAPSMSPTHLSGTVFTKADRLYFDTGNTAANMVFHKGTGTAYDSYELDSQPIGGTVINGYTMNGRILHRTVVGKGWDDGKYDVIFSSIATQPATSWNISQSSYSDTTGLFNLFQFGLVDNGQITTGDISATSSNTGIGQHSTFLDYDEYFRGIVDEVRYSSTDRSVDWASTEYTNLTCPYLIYSVDGVRPDEYYTLTRGALSPVDNGTGASTTGLVLSITYNKEVYPFKGDFYLRRSSDNSIVETIPANDPTRISGYGTNTLSIALSSTLDDTTSYYVNFDSKAIVDFCGQIATPISNNSTWNFTTGGAAPPDCTITLSPVDNGTGIALNANLVLTCNEDVQAGTGDIIIYESGLPFESIPIGNPNVTISGNTVTVDPSFSFNPLTNYHVLIAAGVIENLSGLDFPGILSATDWNFTTGDTIDPTITTLNPADNSTGVAVGTNLVITFSEIVDVETGNIIIRRVSDNVAVHTIDVTSGLVTGTGTNTITIDPSSDLASSTDYYVEIDATAFDDPSGNSFAGISGNTTWNFTTADVVAPTITALNPADNSTGVAVGTNLVITFSEIVDVETGNIIIRRVSDNVAVHTIDVTSGLVTGTGTNTITINPSTNLNPFTAYYVEIDATAFDDPSGNSFAGISGNTTWNFTTTSIPGWLSSDWQNRIKITVNSSQVNGNLTNFPVYLDLSDLPASFFSNVQSNGSDIRVTLADGLTMLPIEVVSINTISLSGELYFKATDLSSTIDTEFYLYYNNPNVSMRNGADTLGAQNVWSNNYVAVYHMQQLPGQGNALIFDSTANRNHFTPNGSMTNSDLETGKLGSSINFDGTNDYLSAPDSVSLDSASGVGQARTISYWLKTTDSGNKVILEKDTNQHFVEQISSSQAVAATNSSTFALSTTNISDNNWHLVNHTYSGTTNFIFVDSGSYEDSDVEAAPVDNNNPLVLAARAGGSFPYLGNLDEVRISNTERSENWINAEFVNQNSPNTFYTISAQEGVNDTDNPKTSTLYPSTQSIQHPIRHSLKMIFNEVVNFGNGNINIHNYSNDVIFETIDINNATRVSGNGTNIITFTTSSDLAQNTKYYVLIDYGAIEDTTSNQFSSIWNKDTWVFTTQGRDSIKKHQIFILNGN